ncbi:hypothetical protein [Paracoccus sediminilitoris]|uniref:hypothetical protein n=1 Tax=Paracoccus sediminilitoris TaxID=2202419 RepID=UPI00272C2D10|nr:hypothetical protein [Paracoccus sediminilitoris]
MIVIAAAAAMVVTTMVVTAVIVAAMVIPTMVVIATAPSMVIASAVVITAAPATVIAATVIATAVITAAIVATAIVAAAVAILRMGHRRQQAQAVLRIDAHHDGGNDRSACQQQNSQPGSHLHPGQKGLREHLISPGRGRKGH